MTRGAPIAYRPASGRWRSLLSLPPGTDLQVRRVLWARSLRALGDGYLAVLLPAYLLALGLGVVQVGLIVTATLLGSAAATLAVGAVGYRFAPRSLLLASALLMAGTGLGFAGLGSFWPLLVVAFVGTLNPSSGDVSVFLPLEHARIAAAAHGAARTTLFARYSVLGAAGAALGSLAAAVPEGLVRWFGITPLQGLRAMFALYAVLGLAVLVIYRGLRAHVPVRGAVPGGAGSPLGVSRGVVLKLAALFSVDAFAGGLVVNSLLSLWLMQRFGLTPAQAGTFFFVTGMLNAASLWAAPAVAERFGLVRTMVFTHLPANVCLMAAALAPGLPWALALLCVRAALSQMDVPTRSAYVMAVVTEPERTAAASFTAVPRSLAAALSPALGGALLATGWLALPLLACGALKIAYDLALWRSFAALAPRE